MAAARTDVQRTIGSLEQAVKTLTEQWSKQDSEAAEGRRRLYEKVEELKGQQSRLATQVERLTEKYGEIAPAVKQFETTRQRAEGAKSLGKLLWFALIAFASGLGYACNALLQYFWPPRH